MNMKIERTIIVSVAKGEMSIVKNITQEVCRCQNQHLVDNIKAFVFLLGRRIFYKHFSLYDPSLSRV